MELVSFAEVLARPDVWRGGRCADGALPVTASGFAALDAALPGGGWPREALTEVLCDGAGLGEVSLLLPALARLCREDGWLLLVAPPHPLQASAWQAAGVPLQRLVVVAPTGKGAARDALWAVAQGLVSAAPAAIVCWSREADARALRRLQVAAAAGRSALFLFRPLATAGQSSPAPLRLQVAAGAAGEVQVRILKRRGPPLAHPLSLAVPRPALWRGAGPALAGPGAGVSAEETLNKSVRAESFDWAQDRAVEAQAAETRDFDKLSPNGRELNRGSPNVTHHLIHHAAHDAAHDAALARSLPAASVPGRQSEPFVA